MGHHPHNPDAGLNFDKTAVKGRDEPVGDLQGFLQELRVDPSIATRQEAIEAARVVLCELTRRLSGGVGHEVMDDLPQGLWGLLNECQRLEYSPKRRGTARSFVGDVSDELGVNPDKGEQIIRAVFTAVRDRLPEHEIEAAAAQLPPDLANLWRRPV